MNHTLLSAPLLAAALLLAGCSTPLSSPSDAKVPTATEVLGQSALPPGSSLKPEQSFIMGAGEQWLGRAVADVGRDTEAAFRFFLEAYPAQGWTLISAVRGKTSLLVFTRQDRSVTVELSEGGALSSGTAVVTVSPRSANAAPAAARPGGAVVVPVR
jgi:hypothetical protein